jgi:hypothetical protein
VAVVVVVGDAALAGIAAIFPSVLSRFAGLPVLSPEVPPAPALSQGFGGDTPDMLMGAAL